jgi:hypothetical protein
MKAKYKGPGYHHGIPARDLTEADWERLTPAQREIVKASPLYELVEAKKGHK